MKHKLSVIALYTLKCMAIAVIFILPGLLMLTAKADRFYSELYSELGINAQDGKSNLKQGFIYGFLYHGGVRNLKNIMVNNKKAVAEDLLEYTSEYVKTEGFKTDYREFRLLQKPHLLAVAPVESAVNAKYIDVISRQMHEIQCDMDMKDKEPGIRKLYQDQYDLLSRQRKDFMDPKSKTMKFVMQNEALQFEAAVKSYSEELSKWQTEYPENEIVFLENKLEKFLLETNDIDYNAATMIYNGRKHFVNAELEAKPASWKYAFLAGANVTNSVRSYVVNWLSQLC